MFQPSLEYLTAAYQRRDLSPLEVIRGSIERIEQVNPIINAIYHLDSGSALEAAEASERRWRNKEPLGPLDGIPITIKDALPTKGMPTFRGAASEVARVAEYDHPTVARVREAGAIILGKNAMCDYGILASGISTQHGVTRNPWNPQWNTGASSSGAAASVAAGIEPATIGTDIVGSIRIPASFCGLAGLKPSQGRVPYYFPNHPALVAGPMARNVIDLALMMNVLTLPDARDFTALEPTGTDYGQGLDKLDPSLLRVMAILDLGLGVETAPSVRSALRALSDALCGVGVNVEVSNSLPFDRADLAPVEDHYLMRCFCELSNAPPEMQRRSEYLYSWTRRATGISGISLQRSLNAIQLLKERAIQLLGEADFLILPSTSDTAFAADQLAPPGCEPFALWGATCLFNLTGQPAASVPFGTDEDGKPIGIQIVGRRFADIDVLRFARLVEKLAPELGNPKGLDSHL